MCVIQDHCLFGGDCGWEKECDGVVVVLEDGWLVIIGVKLVLAIVSLLSCLGYR